MSKFLVLLLSVSLMATTVSFAEEDIDPALKDVQELLRTESKRNEVIIKDNPKDQQAKIRGIATQVEKNKSSTQAAPKP